MGMKTKTFVFISYARQDSHVALRIQKFLEGEKIPTKIVPEGTPLPESRYIRRVFVDTEDLSVGRSDFREELRKALGEAEYLLVLCSRHSARPGSFVNREIDYFLKKCNGKTERILPIALEGVKMGGDEACVPDALRKIIETRNIVLLDEKSRDRSSFRQKMFKVIEFLLNVPANQIHDRYFEWMKKKLEIAIGVAGGVVLVVFSLLVYGIRQERARTVFEQKVFPMSIDYSYIKAFLGPLMASCTNSECVVILAMPKNYDELSNLARQKKAAVSNDAANVGWILRDTKVRIPTFRGPRDLNTSFLTRVGKPFAKETVFVDMVSQLSSVKAVVDYLTTNSHYHKLSDREKLTERYLVEFKNTLLELLQKEPLLKGDPAERIKFVTDARDLEQVLNEITQKQERREEEEIMRSKVKFR